MGIKEKIQEIIQEKKKLLLGLGILTFVIVGGLAGLAMLGDSVNQMEQAPVANFGNPNNAMQQDPAIQQADSAGAEVIEISANSSREELEAAAISVMDELEMLSAEQQQVLERMDNIGIELKMSSDNIDQQTALISKLRN